MNHTQHHMFLRLSKPGDSYWGHLQPTPNNLESGDTLGKMWMYYSIKSLYLWFVVPNMVKNLQYFWYDDWKRKVPHVLERRLLYSKVQSSKPGWSPKDGQHTEHLMSYLHAICSPPHYPYYPILQDIMTWKKRTSILWSKPWFKLHKQKLKRREKCFISINLVIR